MKPTLYLVIALQLVATATLACNEGRAIDLAKSPMPEKADASFDVAEQQSAEGGTWDIYNGPNGTPQRILRTDYGEMGRVELRLAITGPGDFLIMKTQWHYSAPIYSAGKTIREEIDFIEFCGGKLELPGTGEWAVNADYEKLARESVDAFLNAPEIEEQLKLSGIKPPLWK